MLELKFDAEQIKQLVKQRDAEYLNREDDSMVAISQVLYIRREDGYYYNALQEARVADERQRKEKRGSRKKV